MIVAADSLSDSFAIFFKCLNTVSCFFDQGIRLGSKLEKISAVVSAGGKNGEKLEIEVKIRIELGIN